MNPGIFQRISMAKDTKQAAKAFLIAGVLCLLVELLICWVGVLLFATNSELDTKELLLNKNHGRLSWGR